MATTISDMIRLKGTGHGTFESLARPERMGNTANIGYGGCVLSMVVSAAFQTVETPSRGRMALYSALGHFLGPALTDRTIILRVTSLRDTRTFATRHIVATQKQDDDSERACLSAQLDFVASPTEDPDLHSFLRYSIPPPQSVVLPNLPLFHQQIKDRVKIGDLNPNVETAYSTYFTLFDKFFDFKAPPNSPHCENVMGIDKTRRTSQDHLPLTSKTTRDYFRLKSPFPPICPLSSSHLPISPTCLHFASFAFAVDAALSFIPLTLSHHFLPDVGACSSLDFALRFHTDVLDLAKWHQREMRTIAGDYGRTFNEARIWNEEGKLVATMNQQGILRPHKVRSETGVDAKL